MSARPVSLAAAKSSAELKRLQTRRHEVQTDLSRIRHELKGAEETHRLALESLRKIDEQIEKLTQKGREPVVSEHALLRYAERVLKIDFEKIRHDILDAHTVEMIKFTKTGRIKGEKYDLVIKDGVVTTVVTDEGE